MAYLTKYPDVLKAVMAGTFKNGFEHYDKHGRDDSREYNCLYEQDSGQGKKSPFDVDSSYFEETQ